MIQWPIHHLFFLFQVRIHLQKHVQVNQQKKETKYNVFVFSYTIIKLEVQYWGQTMQTIKLVENTWDH